MKSNVKLAAIFGCAAIGLAVTGCNTIEGFGKDLISAGTALSGSKDEKKAQQANTPQPVAPAPATAAAPAPAPQRR
jgi:predicted small secreted protein